MNAGPRVLDAAHIIDETLISGKESDSLAFTEPDMRS